MKIDTSVLEKIGLFKRLNKEQLYKILPVCHLVKLKRDRSILRMDHAAQELFFVIEGKADIRFDLPAVDPSEEVTTPSVEEMTISSAQAGETVGWSSMVEPHRYILSVYCGSDTCLIGKILGEDLRRIFEDDNSIGYIVMNNLAQVISDRCRTLQYEVLRQGPWR